MIIAGTIFESSKLPLTIWFQAIYLLTQTKKGVSAMQLHRQLGISYNAAWRMKHKLMQVMLERGEKQRLSALVQMDDAYLGGERSGGRRRRSSSRWSADSENATSPAGLRSTWPPAPAWFPTG